MPDINQRCGICCNQIKNLCIDCQGNDRQSSEDDECKVAWGVCDHAYHFHCISRWLEGNTVCPLDNIEWRLKRFDNQFPCY